MSDKHQDEEGNPVMSLHEPRCFNPSMRYWSASAKVSPAAAAQVDSGPPGRVPEDLAANTDGGGETPESLQQMRSGQRVSEAGGGGGGGGGGWLMPSDTNPLWQPN